VALPKHGPKVDFVGALFREHFLISLNILGISPFRGGVWSLQRETSPIRVESFKGGVIRRGGGCERKIITGVLGGEY